MLFFKLARKQVFNFTEPRKDSVSLVYWAKPLIYLEKRPLWWPMNP